MAKATKVGKTGKLLKVESVAEVVKRLDARAAVIQKKQITISPPVRRSFVETPYGKFEIRDAKEPLDFPLERHHVVRSRRKKDLTHFSCCAVAYGCKEEHDIDWLEIMQDRAWVKFPYNDYLIRYRIPPKTRNIIILYDTPEFQNEVRNDLCGFKSRIITLQPVYACHALTWLKSDEWAEKSKASHEANKNKPVKQAYNKKKSITMQQHRDGRKLKNIKLKVAAKKAKKAKKA